MNSTEDPRPRTVPKPWSPYLPQTLGWTYLPVPHDVPSGSFADVLSSRRSAVGGTLDFCRVGELFWHAAATKGSASSGRAGIPIEWRATPSSGGLHPIHLVCVPDTVENGIFIYDAQNHAVAELSVAADAVVRTNAEAVTAVVGRSKGWTIRFIADFAKLDAAYENAWSLLLRDSGCLLI